MQSGRALTHSPGARTGIAVVVASLSVLLSWAFACGSAFAVTDPGGGSDVAAISARPYQVLLEMTDSSGDYYCGGVILNASTVATAAHCLFDDQGTAFVASEVSLIAGVSAFDPATYLSAPSPGDAEQDDHAAGLRIDPGFDPNAAVRADDVATVSLQTPLDLTGQEVRAIGLVGSLQRPALGSALTLSGYGAQTAGANLGDGHLRVASQTAGDSSTTGATNALWLVTSGDASSCAGDSGGPVVNSAGQLVGIISGASGCGASQQTDAADVAVPEVRDFLMGDDAPPAAPRGGSGADLSSAGAARPGATLTCTPGTWSATPTYSYAFVDARTGIVLQSGTGATYVIGTRDTGRSIGCIVTATTAGGVATARALHAFVIGAAASGSTPPAPGVAAALFFGAPRRHPGRTTIGLTVALSATTKTAVTGARVCLKVTGATFATTRVKHRCRAIRSFAAPRTPLLPVAITVSSRTAAIKRVRVALVVTQPHRPTGGADPLTPARVTKRAQLRIRVLARSPKTRKSRQGASK